MFKLNPSAVVLSLSAAALLSACGGGGGGSAAAPSLSGVAAVGAPIVGGDVDAKCSDGNTYNANPTSTTGAWSIATVPAAAFPCVVQVRNGDPASVLNSYAAGPGVVNITPFTDLLLAMAARGNPSDYFTNVSESNKAELTSEMNAAIAKLKTALVTGGYLATGDSFDPINARFTAAKGNFYDDLLEAFKKGLNNDSGKIYDDILASVIANPDADLVFPDAPPKETGGGTTTPGSDTVAGTVHSSLVKTYNLNFKKGGGTGCGSDCSFTEGQEIIAIVGADNSLTVNSKRLSNPFNRTLSAGGTPHLPEIIWLDGNIEYALSDNKRGIFNEINIGKSKSGGGAPGFIGQLKAAEVKDDPVAKLKPFAGSYVPKFVLKSNYNLPSQTVSNPPVNADIKVSISTSGIIKVDEDAASGPLVFDPAASSYDFKIEPANEGKLMRYIASYMLEDSSKLSIYISFAENNIVAWRIEQAKGSGRNSSLLAESYTDKQKVLINSLINADIASIDGIKLTAISDDESSDKRFKKCDKLALDFFDENRNAQKLYKLLGYDSDKKTYSRFLNSGVFDRQFLDFDNFSDPTEFSVAFAKIGQRKGTGFIDFTKLDSITRSGLGRATNDPTDILNAGCGGPT